MNIHSQIVKVLATTYNKGDGTPADPVRRATSYYSLEGDFLCERDELDVAIEEDKRVREMLSKARTN